MDESGNKGVWIGLIVCLLAALAFGILWFLRGGDIDGLRTELRTSQTAAASQAQRLESDLRSARNDVSTRDRKVSELEARLRDDVRRAQEAGQAAERRLQLDLDMAASRLTEAQREAERLRFEAEEAAQTQINSLRNNLRDTKTALDRMTEEHSRIQENLATASAGLEKARLDMGKAEAELRETRGIVRNLKEKAEKDGRTLAETDGELAAARRELAELQSAFAATDENAKKLVASLEGDLNSARRTILEQKKRTEEDSKRLADLEAELSKTAEELKRLREAGSETGASANDDDAGAARLEELAALRRDVESARGREADLARRLEELMQRLRQAEEAAGKAAAEQTALKERMERETRTLRDKLAARENELLGRNRELTERLASASADADGAAAERDALREKMERDTTALRGALAAREKELLGKNRELSDRLAGEAAERNTLREKTEREAAALRDALAAREKELLGKNRELSDRLAGEAAEKDALRKKAEREAAALRDALAAREKALLEQSRELANRLRRTEEKAAADAADSSARMAKARDAALARIAALEEKFASREQELLRKAEEERGEFLRQIEELRKEAAPAPTFAAGRIVGRMPDGATLLISGGAGQRVKPGVKFDVYRPHRGSMRYIGAVRVVRVFDGYSLAVSTYGGEEVKLCPVTGRAVHDPSVADSPFAEGAKLVTLPGSEVFDAPAVGDHIDNPFYSPARPIRFGLDGDVAGNVCVQEAIGLLGGIPRPPEADDLDYLLVGGKGAAADGGRRISLAHLNSYFEPRMNF